MNNEPHNSQETLGDTSQGGSLADSSVSLLKKYGQKIIIIVLALAAFIVTVQQELRNISRDTVSLTINLQSVPPLSTNKTSN